MSYQTRTNNYRSSNSTIIAGPGTMYNEITRPKPITKVYDNNTNTYAVTAPYIKSTKTRKKTNARKTKTNKSKSK